MNRLKNHLFYLCGSIDAAPDLGVGWREDITVFLQTLNIKVLDPCNKPTPIGWETWQEVSQIKELKQQEKYDEIREKYKIIRQVDLRMVDLSTALIFYYDLTIPTVGSFEEAFLANRSKKPVLIVCPQKKQNLPNWIFLTFPHEHLFNNFDELKTYLTKVDSGEDTNTYGRWVFFDYDKL